MYGHGWHCFLCHPLLNLRVWYHISEPCIQYYQILIYLGKLFLQLLIEINFQIIQLWVNWIGIDVALGSTGNNGKAAMYKCIEWLKRGQSIQVCFTIMATKD